MEIGIGFIGAGNMGSAMIKSIVKAGLVPKEKIYVFDTTQEKMNAMAQQFGVIPAESSAELVEKTDIIIVAVKPDAVKLSLEFCKHKINSDKILVSIAAGIPIKLYRGIVGEGIRIVRVMPNTPALVGEGMTLLSFDQNCHENDVNVVRSIFECLGKVEVLDEKYMSEVIALTSSSPAYVFMFIEAMADAAVLSGIPRQLAYRLAAQAVLGSAKMVLETGKHPAELKDQVCSPSGTTIQAVAALEKNGFRYAVEDAMNECTKRARELGQIYG